MGVLASVGKFFTGGAAGEIVKVGDEFILTAEERMRIDQKDLESARGMQLKGHSSPFDIAVDALSRLVRPVVTFWLMGGLMGFYTFQDIKNIPPFYQSLIVIVLTFWFGGRAIMKDVPKFYYFIFHFL